MDKQIIAIVALTAMEIVLGIDNIVFITIVTGRLPADRRPLAWRIGLGLALIMRIGLLLALTWILGLDAPVFELESLGIAEDWFRRIDPEDAQAMAEWQHTWEQVNGVSWRDVILFVGGLFLVGKSVHEIHHELEGRDHAEADEPKAAGMLGVLIQITLFDVIFSLDSVITAVGMAEDIWVMVTAVVIAMVVMVIFASRIGEFVHRHPTLKMLALSFLILIGVMLIAEGAGTHVNKGYIYFSMFFALVVEALNMRIRHVATS